MVHISQFYPCSRVSLACELYYICELGKYAYTTYGEAVSIDGVLLDNMLDKSPIWEYFRICCCKGWVVGHNMEGFGDSPFGVVEARYLCDRLVNIKFTFEKVEFDKADFDRRNSDYEYNMLEPKKTQVVLRDNRAGVWVIDNRGVSDGDFINNSGLNGRHPEQRWVSLVAFVAVERHYSSYPDLFAINITNDVVSCFMAATYILLLALETPCLGEWCKMTFDNVSVQRQNELGYQAWYIKGKDMGYMNTYSTKEDKHNHIKGLGIQEGDPVFLYKRNRDQASNLIKSISDCHLAIVRNITRGNITLDVVYTSSLRYQAEVSFKNNSTLIKHMYSNQLPYEKANVRGKTYDLMDIGVQYCLYDELYFIVPLYDTSDQVSTLITDGERVCRARLPQNDFVYWLLKDYDIPFNEEHFLSLFFKNSDPAYKVYLSGGDLDASYYEEVSI